jgi:hypothetical protein
MLVWYVFFNVYVSDQSTVQKCTLPLALPSMTIVARRDLWAESANTLFRDFSPTLEITLGDVVKAFATAKSPAR